MRPARGSRGAAGLVAGLLVLAACSPGSPDASTGSDPGPEEVGWPAPDPGRPVVELDYVVAEGHGEVQGRERITFAPDLPVCEVVLRAWPNKPFTAEWGNSLAVRQAWVDGERREVRELPAGAPDGSPGTLLEVPLEGCAEAGQELEVEVDFVVEVGEGTDERMGRDPDQGIVWLGTAYPVLAWQPGVGWATEDAVRVVGEMTTSATFDLARLSVTVPEGQEVAGVGERLDAGGGESAGQGTRTVTFAAPAMRDVAVTAGDIEVHDLAAGDVAVHLVAPRGLDEQELEQWGEVVSGTLEDLVALLGPYPYPSLWVSLLPVTEGVELSGAVQVGQGDPEERRWVVAHELAHQWFYGLVGNNQAAHPWLDEAFASALQELVAPMGWEPGRRELEGALGWPMAEWERLRRGGSAYVDTVYTGGGLLLRDLREQVGEEAWDAAVRDYLRAQAHQIAEPQDLRAALAGLPGVDDALGEAGAWDER